MGAKKRTLPEKPVVDHGEMMIYQTEDGLTKIDVSLRDETVWLSKSQMAELFQRDRSVISRHIKNVFNEGELPEKSNVQILHIATSDRPVSFYSLDVIISVGYRVKSIRGTQFRIWATSVIKEYMIKGFAMDDERLKGNGGGTYWKELLTNAGKISHDQAMRKAKEEYRKFQQAALTPVDKAYLNSLKAIGKKAEKRVKER
ncbi:MAG: virulence RhuM family protein [Eubacteriaceae bacterium]|nr:virulence RhuM family protein [Eubacteriaceae bacterium]